MCVSLIMERGMYLIHAILKHKVVREGQQVRCIQRGLVCEDFQENLILLPELRVVDVGTPASIFLAVGSLIDKRRVLEVLVVALPFNIQESGVQHRLAARHEP